jgi:DNA-binding beta-propeller fold protein YncE
MKTRAISRMSGLFLACLALFTGSLFASTTQLRYLYAVDPTGAGGQILAYSITPITGKLVPLTCSPIADTAYPVAAIVDRDGAFLYVANQLPAEISTYSINLNTGCLTYDSSQPLATTSVPFAMGLTAHDAYLYVSDTATNQVWELTNNPPGTLAPAVPYPAGPFPLEGLAVDPVGSFVFAANDYSSVNGEIQEGTYGAGGALPPLTPYTTSPSVTPNPFEMAVDPVGQCLLVTNNPGADMTTYSINPLGALVAVTSLNVTGTNPWGVTIDVQDQLAYVANNGSGTVSGYTIEPGSCKLGNVTGSPFSLGLGALRPEGLSADPTGRFLYVADNNGYISEYTINEKTGKLVAIVGSPLATPGLGTAPVAIAIQP